MSKYITINDTIVRTPADRPYDGYEHLEAGIRESFEDALGPDNKEPLFFTNVENLYDIFLDHIPEEARQHYNCNACRNFVNRYGGLVTIDEASACGLSLQAGTNKIWKCELRVTTDVGVSKYKLDRWD